MSGNMFGVSDPTKKSEETTKKELQPCSNVSNLLYQALFMFMIPILASIYCIMQLLYRGLMGIPKFLDFGEIDHANKVKMVFGYAIFWLMFFIILPIFIYVFAGRFTSLDILIGE
jgi:hypothetical protein